MIMKQKNQKKIFLVSMAKQFVVQSAVKGKKHSYGQCFFIKIWFSVRSVRKHWYVENKLHWVLDVVFKEDYCRVRTSYGAENLTAIRKIALNTIKRDNTVKTSIKNKRKMCGWDDSYALNILKNMKA